MRKRGEYKGGVTQGVYGGRDEGGEEEKRGEGVQALQIEVFASVFDAHVNEIKKIQKKSFSNFWFFNFFSINLPCERMKRMNFRKQNTNF